MFLAPLHHFIRAALLYWLLVTHERKSEFRHPWRLYSQKMLGLLHHFNLQLLSTNSSWKSWTSQKLSTILSIGAKSYYIRTNNIRTRQGIWVVSNTKNYESPAHTGSLIDTPLVKDTSSVAPLGHGGAGYPSFRLNASKVYTHESLSLPDRWDLKLWDQE